MEQLIDYKNFLAARTGSSFWMIYIFGDNVFQ